MLVHLSNEHGDLYFLLHKIVVQIIAFQVKKIKKKIVRKEKKKISLKECTQPFLQDANYDLENNDSRNVLSQCRLELCDVISAETLV